MVPVHQVLPVPFLERDVRIQQAARLVVFVERGHRHAGVEHELAEIGLEAHDVLDVVRDVVGRVMLQAHDGRAENGNPVVAQFADEPRGVDAGVFGVHVRGVGGLEPDPDEHDAQSRHVLDAKGGDRFRRGGNVEAEPALVLLHEREQFHRARPVFQEVLVHDVELGRARRIGDPAALFEDVLPGAEERDVGLLEEMRRAAEVAAVHAAEAGHEDAGRYAGNRNSENAAVFGAREDRVMDRCVGILAEEPAHPADALAARHVVADDQLLDALDRRAVSAEDDDGIRRVQPDQPGHLAGLQVVWRDERNADDVVVVLQLADEPRVRREVEDGCIGVDVRGDEVQAERAMVESERRRTLDARHLIVVKLHQVFFAPVFVIHAVRAKDAAEEDARGFTGVLPLGMFPGGPVQYLFHAWGKGSRIRPNC